MGKKYDYAKLAERLAATPTEATATTSSTGPIQVFNDRELATVLHALRLYQDVRMYGRERSREYGCSDQTGCDHFEEVPPLSVDEIDALCERLNLAPPPPTPPDPKEAAYIAQARAQYVTDDIEIDDNPKLSRADESEGTWVAAWVWVADAEVEEEEEEDTDEVCPHCGEKGVAYGAHCNMVDHEDTHISEGYCPEHGLVKTVDDAGIDKCPDCGRATSFDAEEAARFEHQDDEPDPKYTEDDWAQEVRDGNTLRSFREWALAKTEEAL